MESGTVLHIALLKKLSSHYPSGQLCSRFYQFKRCSPAHSSSRPPSFEKYGRSSPFLGERGGNPRRGRQERKFSRVMQGQADSLCGWNVENQQQVSYTEKLKRDQYNLFPHLLEATRKQPARIRFEKSRSQRAVLNASRIMNATETAPGKCTIQFGECKYSSAIHVRPEEKENELQLEPLPATIKQKRRRSKDRSITASPLSSRPKRIRL